MYSRAAEDVRGRIGRVDLLHERLRQELRGIRGRIPLPGGHRSLAANGGQHRHRCRGKRKRHESSMHL